MSLWSALAGELEFGLILCAVGLLVLVTQLLVHVLSGRTRPNIRFHRIDDFVGNRVRFLIRNFDPVRYRGPLVVGLRPAAAIERVSAHGVPFCKTVPREGDHDTILVTFEKIPADATFTIQVTYRPGETVTIELEGSSALRSPRFDRRLQPFSGARRLGYFLGRGLLGLSGFLAMFWIGLLVAGDEPTASEWTFLGAAAPLALAVFALVVPTGGKPLVTGYLGWSGASKDWVRRR